ncbi:uncharacterized protein LOC126896867 [Daktulosphaira vitifoliae]|uniref:uncharacterized protein LOC126896867 n=1 Tax=Daktulosphaira vitifoliae TaxID=58002 RepID=UPI0021AA561F|nr:uncharacterized protein LOC126896867 [Daktulosphaira vitifoliae]
MYYNIFIMMYLTTSFTNAFLFKFPPLDEENNGLNKEAKNTSINYYSNNMDPLNGMSLDIFVALFKLFSPIHKMNDSDIANKFFDEVQNDEFMALERFLKIMTEFVIITEDELTTTYKEYLNQDGKMTKKEFEELVKGFNSNITADIFTNIITENCTDAQNISFPEFRVIAVEFYYKLLESLKVKLYHEEGIYLKL